MKFNQLYSQIFTEQEADTNIPEDEISAPEAGVPEPDQYDVEPAPISTSTSNTGTLKTYITKLNDFAKLLNDTDTESLQKTVSDLDRPMSLFQNISKDTSVDIAKIAGDITQLAQTLNAYIINSYKRQREVATGQ
jgi:predicted acetyltransferase